MSWAVAPTRSVVNTSVAIAIYSALCLTNTVRSYPTGVHFHFKKF